LEIRCSKSKQYCEYWRLDFITLYFNPLILTIYRKNGVHKM
jgi:hypothetical protein